MSALSRANFDVRDVGQCSLRIAICVVVIFVAFAFIFLVVFFLSWILSKKQLVNYRPTRRV